MSTDLACHPTVNALLVDLLSRAKGVLQDHFVGMYLDGSLATGNFDCDSDIDFVVIADIDITNDLFLALQGMHKCVSASDNAWATQLEGYYISRRAVRRFDPPHPNLPNIQRGHARNLELVPHDEAWAIHRHTLREYGMTLEGPAPKSLIDPVTSDQLLRAMNPMLKWLREILGDPGHITHRGYQSYIVLTLCRILYTIEFGDIASKPLAARWAQESQGERWASLIERTWESRHNPGGLASADDLHGTLEFIQYTLARSEN
jgi:hypothetical protein